MWLVTLGGGFGGKQPWQATKPKKTVGGRREHRNKKVLGTKKHFEKPGGER